MSRTGKVLGAVGLAAAGVAAAEVARHQHVIAHRGAGDQTPLGQLRGTKLQIVADDGVDLYAEIDEPDQYDGARATDDDLTLIFVHGYTLNLDCWHFQRAAFRGRVRMVFYDQRSHGRSARSSEANSTIDQLGHDLARVIEHTAPGPCVLVGHSMGGMSIISMAEHYSELFGEKVVGVSLISTTAGGLDPGRILFPMLPLGIGGKFMGRVQLLRQRHGQGGANPGSGPPGRGPGASLGTRDRRCGH